MENKELNSIDVSMFEQDEVINLLLKIVELSNGKVTLLNKRIAGLASKQDELKKENEALKKEVESLTEEKTANTASIQELNGKLASLDKELCGANETIEEQATTVQELNGKLASLDKELCGANETIEEQATTIQELNGKLASLDKELRGANETIEEQATTIQELNGKLASLDKELCGANALVDEKNVEIAKLYANMFAKLLECRKTEDSSAWNSFLEEICLKITKFIENTTNLENLSYSLESANSWLTKIASIIWWSGQPAVSAIVNDNLPNVNGMNEIFRDFLLFLKNLKITVLLPVAGFCDEIKEYEANVNERSVFNKLFGSAGLSEGVLCEIYKLAINGNSGLCLIYRA